MPLDDLVDRMRERIQCEYEDAANSVGYCSSEGGYLLSTMDSYELLEEVGVYIEDETLRDDLAQGLPDVAWVHQDPYALTRNEALHHGWKQFVDLVKHRNRYLMFSRGRDDDDREPPHPAEMLDQLGQFLVEYQLFRTLKVGTRLHRVRIHSPGHPPANTALALGPPPREFARFSNRMSPAGVSMLYVALDEKTAMAETYVRLDGRDAEATTAVFEVSHDLELLDLTTLPEVPSIFDGDEPNIRRADIAFLHAWVRELTSPVVKDGREHVEYVPSQVVTEYVRFRLEALAKKNLSGILYRSARRTSGIGCVLFVESRDLDERRLFGRKPPVKLLPELTHTGAVPRQA